MAQGRRPKAPLEGLNTQSRLRHTCLSDRISDISDSGNPYIHGTLYVHTQESNQIWMLVSKPPWPPLVVRRHLHAIFLAVVRFRGEYMSKRRDGIILMFTVTFEVPLKLAPVKPMRLLPIKSLASSNIPVAIELLARHSKIASFQPLG